MVKGAGWGLLRVGASSEKDDGVGNKGKFEKGVLDARGGICWSFFFLSFSFSISSDLTTGEKDASRVERGVFTPFCQGPDVNDKYEHTCDE